MTAAEARRRIQELARAGNVSFRQHAVERMRQRGIRRENVLRALRYCAHCEAYDVDGWRVIGRDDEGLEVAVGVKIEDNVIVMTVMWP